MSSDVTTFYISAAEGSTVDAAADAMDRILNERFDEDDDAYDVDASNMLEEAMNTVTSTLSILLGGHCHRAHPGNRHPQGHRRQPG